MNKTINSLIVALCLVIALTLSGCVVYPGDPSATPLPPLDKPVFTDHETAFAMYDQVTFPMMIDDVRKLMGEPKLDKLESGESYSWRVGDYGLAAAFYDSGRLRGKVVQFDDIRQLTGLMPGKPNLAAAEQLQEGISYQEAAALMGCEGLEISQIAQDASTNPQLTRLLVWVDENGSQAQVEVDGAGKVVRTAMSLVQSGAPAAADD